MLCVVYVSFSAFGGRTKKERKKERKKEKEVEEKTALHLNVRAPTWMSRPITLDSEL